LRFDLELNVYLIRYLTYVELYRYEILYTYRKTRT
jgi:hypothetical protein